MKIEKIYTEFVYETASLTTPDAIVWLRGTSEGQTTNKSFTKIIVNNNNIIEQLRLCNQMVAIGTLIPLKNRPNSYYARSSPDDVARLEDATLICSSSINGLMRIKKILFIFRQVKPKRCLKDAGPTNKWKSPEETHAMLVIENFVIYRSNPKKRNNVVAII